MTEEKIPVPEAVAARMRQDAERETALKNAERWLDEQHRKAAEEEPLGGFKIRLPLEDLRNLTPGERDRFYAFEQAAHERHKEAGMEKHGRRAAWIAAGGAAAEFEAYWEEYGREASFLERAEENYQRRRQGSFFGASPY